MPMVRQARTGIAWVIFDWGNTVMRDFPQYAGPMVSWPEVAAMPGIAQALARLEGRYGLALATNAGDSGAAQVRAALARVGLERYFTVVLTARELRASKPDPAFFEAILARCECLPHQAVMIGDSFRTDVVGAKHASLWAVWYNPERSPAPPDVPIGADGELGSWSEIDAVLQALEQCVGRMW